MRREPRPARSAVESEQPAVLLELGANSVAEVERSPSSRTGSSRHARHRGREASADTTLEELQAEISQLVALEKAKLAESDDPEEDKADAEAKAEADADKAEADDESKASGSNSTANGTEGDNATMSNASAIKSNGSVANATVAKTRELEEEVEASQFYSSMRVAISSVTIFIIYIIAAAVYNGSRKKPRGSQGPQSNNAQDPWTFGYGAFECGEDRNIFLCALCCLPVRWADTLDKINPPILEYWTGVCLFSACCAFCGPLGMAVVGMSYRQKLRTAFVVKDGGSTYLDDCCGYYWCGPCVATQEARCVEDQIAKGGPALDEGDWVSGEGSYMEGSQAAEEMPPEQEEGM